MLDAHTKKNTHTIKSAICLHRITHMLLARYSYSIGARVRYAARQRTHKPSIVLVPSLHIHDLDLKLQFSLLWGWDVGRFLSKYNIYTEHIRNLHCTCTSVFSQGNLEFKIVLPTRCVNNTQQNRVYACGI